MATDRHTKKLAAIRFSEQAYADIEIIKLAQHANTTDAVTYALREVAKHFEQRAIAAVLANNATPVQREIHRVWLKNNPPE